MRIHEVNQPSMDSIINELGEVINDDRDVSGPALMRLKDILAGLKSVRDAKEEDLSEARPLEHLCRRLGVMLQDKNDSYGSSFYKAEDFIALLWPDGVPPEAFGRMLIMVRMFDKMMRIAVMPEAFGEDAEMDLFGYAALMVYLGILKGKGVTP